MGIADHAKKVEISENLAENQLLKSGLKNLKIEHLNIGMT